LFKYVKNKICIIYIHKHHLDKYNTWRYVSPTIVVGAKYTLYARMRKHVTRIKYNGQKN